MKTELGPIFSDALRFFGGHAREIAALCLPFLVASAVLEAILDRIPQAPLLPMAGFFVFYPFYTIALIRLMAYRAGNQFPPNSVIVMETLKQWWPFLVLSVTAMLITTLGLMLLILPGIWMAVRLAFAEILLVLHQLKPQAALLQSYSATRKHAGTILACLLIFTLPVGLLSYGIHHYLGSIGAAPFWSIAAETGISYLGLFGDVLVFRIFMEAMAQDTGPEPWKPDDGTNER